MTTIAYRAGVMAADSRAYGGSKLPIGEKCKIKRLDNGTLIGVTSTIVGASSAVMAWYEAGCPAKPEVDLPESFSLLVVEHERKAFYAENKPLLSGPLHADFFAIGSGEEYALGALAFGANAVQAVAMACKLDVWSELPVYATSHSGEVPKIKVDLPPESFIWAK